MNEHFRVKGCDGGAGKLVNGGNSNWETNDVYEQIREEDLRKRKREL